MYFYDKLTLNRKAFLNQLYNLIDNQFKAQSQLQLSSEEIIRELNENPEYIQRIFINSPWGMGKTFFSKALKEKIEKENETREEEIKLININAWETDYFSDPMKSMVGEINSNIRLSPETTDKVEQILKKGLTIFGKSIFNKGLEKIGIDETKRKELETLFKEVTEFETSELEDYKKYKKLVDKFKENLSLEKDLKVIVIDELDRCKPNYAIELLETVKHFFGVKNIIFIFLVNKEQLKSIVSTSYLTDDKCSEYFEKFFDIQFKLPELEYDEFIKIEYSLYNDISTFELENKNTILNSRFNNYNISKKNNEFYIMIFLEVFKSNCNNEEVSPRKFIKTFKKFKLLLNSLSDKEKFTYPLMLILILYFIKEEFFSPIDKKIEELFLNTFFTYNKEKIRYTLSDKNYFDDVCQIKENYTSDYDFYEYFYFMLLYKIGIKENNGQIKYALYLNRDNIYKAIHYTLNQVKLTFDNISSCHGTTRYDTEIILISAELFISSNIDIQKYITKNNVCDIKILEKWAKDKYNFVIQQEK